ncbi:hypothetical protein Y032_0010g1192 [Ancylostoma ceylanicum]|uniref:Uncharacterized protein n=1 Tax=Ancylostoma ceylanicum TaxID=53326 RepID=A0A016VFV9_9BILA|nr:hypothetical protein Y032_0010g1192 [Ancylostoma ceylanicum]
MSFPLLFCTQSRTKDVVPTSTLPADAQCGDVTRVRCDGRSDKAKVLHVGANELCDWKATSVTSDGNLVEDEFDIISPLEDDDDDETREHLLLKSSSQERLKSRIWLGLRSGMGKR